jgi:hypothetical protein
MPCDEESFRSGARDDDIATRDGLCEIVHRDDRDTEFCREILSKLGGFAGVLIVSLDALESAHAAQRAQLHRSLRAATTDERSLAVFARQIFGCHRRRRSRSQRGD